MHVYTYIYIVNSHIHKCQNKKKIQRTWTVLYKYMHISDEWKSGADLGIGGVVAADAHTHTCTQLSLLVWIERESLRNLSIRSNQKLVISRISTSKHSHGPHITDTQAHSLILTHICFAEKCARFAVWFRNLPVYVQCISLTTADFKRISHVSITNLIWIAAALRA